MNTCFWRPFALCGMLYMLEAMAMRADPSELQGENSPQMHEDRLLSAASNFSVAEVAAGSAIHVDSERILSNSGCLCNNYGFGRCGKGGGSRAWCMVEGHCAGANVWDYCDEKAELRKQLQVVLKCFCYYGGERAWHGYDKYVAEVVGRLDDPGVKSMRSGSIAKDKCAQMCCDRARNSGIADLMQEPYQGVISAVYEINYEVADYLFRTDYFWKQNVLRIDDVCPPDEEWSEDHPRACAWPSRCDSYHGHKFKDQHIDNCLPGSHSTATLEYSAGDRAAVWTKAVGGAVLGVVKGAMEEALSPFAGIGRRSGGSSRGGWSNSDMQSAFRVGAAVGGW